MWSYNGEEFTSEMIEDNMGFVYIVTDKKTKMKYIGKKAFFSKVTKPPLKGKKRKRRSLKESDWKTYCGSSETVKELVEENGLDHFDREILYLCKSKGELNYMELREQVIRDVLLKPDEYHNAFVGGKIHRAHIKKLQL
jgi:serine/threonine protein kinase